MGCSDLIFTVARDTVWQHIWVDIESGNVLLPDGSKPLPEPMLTYYQWGSIALTKTNFTGVLIKWVWETYFLNYFHISQAPMTYESTILHHCSPGNDWQADRTYFQALSNATSSHLHQCTATVQVCDKVGPGTLENGVGVVMCAGCHISETPCSIHL